ncbi:MAG: hypothetical protein M1828_005069 [Chrysothrix sp. TS-e1954]|nr:MAG: hypothetical protein M1828_005069 [Chrysothrix sp. TS-e1954]
MDLQAEMQARLEELDKELDEGDITRKGYEKRRTLILSEFFAPATTRSEDSRRSQSSQRPVSHAPSASDDANQASLHALHFDVPPSQVARFQEKQGQLRAPTPQFGAVSDGTSSSTGSRAQTMSRSDFAFNPGDTPSQETPRPTEHQRQSSAYWQQPSDSRMSTMLDSQQYFSDFTGQQGDEQQRDSYGGPQRYSTGEALSPTAPMSAAQELPGAATITHMMPLEPRDIPFSISDPHSPTTQMSQFDTIGAVLRHRGKTNAKQAAYWVLDSKGKETASITWEKLSSKAEKVAQVIRDKSNLYRGDRVALVYRDTEVIDFAIALMGCFIAGVVAVPINNVDDYQKLNLLLQTTQAHLALTTDNNLKAFHRDINTNKLRWPQGVEWWKTNEFGSYHPKRKDDSASVAVPDLAYIEFSRAPTGDFRGVVLSHRTIMHQMACISAIVKATPDSTDTFSSGLRDRNGEFVVRSSRHGETILSYLDPREGVGMILGVFLGVYGGHTTVWLESKTVETAGLYAHLITKYRASVMVADYSRLKLAAYNYQQDPMTTRQFKKGSDPNFSSVKICLIDALAVDSEFHEILADRWFKPMRNDRAREVVAPMLCLPEHGGMIVSVRDWLGGEERMGCPLDIVEQQEVNDGEGDAYNSLVGGEKSKRPMKSKGTNDLTEVLLDKEALKTNEVVVLAIGEEARRRAHEPGIVRAGAFGYPIPDATLAVVDPETCLLCSPFTIGEIWVDSPSLSGGFWALPKHTETIFHARPYRFAEGSPTPVLLDLEFLRTGLLGCVIEGKVFVLGLYEDRIRQKVEWVEHGVQESEHRYFFVQHLVSSIMRNIPKIHDCSAFDVYVNGEYLPIILIETLAASTAPLVPGGPPRQLDIPLLNSLSERCMEVLFHEHHLRVYCVMITAPNTLPKVIKNGRKDIGNMLCRKEFDNGNLPCVHVQFGVERAVQNLPFGDDPVGGIFSPISTQARQELLVMQEKQYSGVDHREVVMDDRTSTPLNQFSNIHDLLQWRVSRQSEEFCLCSVDGRGKEGKGVSWKKFDLKVAAVAMHLRNKVKVLAGDHLILMYTHSEEFVYAVHACYVLGAVAIPMAPIDSNRLSEDSPALLSMIGDFRVKAILVNNETDQLMRQKAVSQHLKQSAMILKINMPNTYNTSKPSKQSHGCRDLGLTMRPSWVQPGYPALIWVYWTPDQRRIAVQLGHNSLMALCKVQKETCQMTSSRPVLACVRSTVGLGFIHMCLMGIYLAAPTYLVSPVDFAQNPTSLFLTLARYKIKDTYATAQLLDYAMTHMPGKGFALHELKNLMISTDGRPRTDIYSKTRLHFAPTGLDRTAINTIYSHVLNPMIASRSYMCIEPIELWLDPAALRRGLIQPVDPDSEPFALMLQDSGMVPVSTQIAIVNPETNRLCHIGEYGEIWVQSDACGHAFYGPRDPLDVERFNGRTVDGDPAVRYVRTGDLGFLHNVSRPIGPGGAQVDMQILFVLGNIGETFDVNGLSHLPMDIESSVERCHRNIASGGCAVFQAGGLVVVLVEVVRRNFLASIVPVIVNSILNAHQIVVDIIAFVSHGDFPRSRLGEKQRGKILGAWVQRKMRTIAQFGIKDPNGADPDTTAAPAIRRSGASLRNGSVRGGSSLKHIESSSALDELQEQDYAPLPTGISEMPAMDDTSMIESPSASAPEAVMLAQDRGDITPTHSRPQHDGSIEYSPVEMPTGDFWERSRSTGRDASQERSVESSYSNPPFISLPSVDGHGSLMSDEDYQPRQAEASRGGLRVANRSSTDSHEWPSEAIMHMNLAGQKYD